MNLEQRIAQAFPHDKCLHFIAGLLVFAVAHFWLGFYALYIVITVACAKEVYDARHKGDQSNNDILATISGGIAGYVCSIN